MVCVIKPFITFICSELCYLLYFFFLKSQSLCFVFCCTMSLALFYCMVLFPCIFKKYIAKFYTEHIRLG